MGQLSEYLRPYGEYVFHQTDPDNRESIEERGVSPNEDSARDTASIEAALDELGYTDPFPFDRAADTYCHVDGDYVREINSESGGLIPESATVVVAVEEIQPPMYLADMGYITDLIDYHFGGIDTVKYADSPEEIVHRYRESIAPVTSAADIRSDPTDRRHPELVVAGAISPSAIVEICSTGDDSITDGGQSEA